MPDSPHYPDTGVGPAGKSTARIPRWVKVSLIVVAVIVIVLVAVMLLGGHEGKPGPGGH
jgi:hypothetical protein